MCRFNWPDSYHHVRNACTLNMQTLVVDLARGTYSSVRVLVSACLVPSDGWSCHAHLFLTWQQQRQHHQHYRHYCHYIAVARLSINETHINSTTVTMITTIMCGGSSSSNTIRTSKLFHTYGPMDTCLHFSVRACHPCAGAMLTFSVAFQV